VNPFATRGPPAAQERKEVRRQARRSRLASPSFALRASHLQRSAAYWRHPRGRPALRVPGSDTTRSFATGSSISPVIRVSSAWNSGLQGARSRRYSSCEASCAAVMADSVGIGLESVFRYGRRSLCLPVFRYAIRDCGRRLSENLLALEAHDDAADRFAAAVGLVAISARFFAHPFRVDRIAQRFGRTLGERVRL
jgi:hypothetical protein